MNSADGIGHVPNLIQEAFGVCDDANDPHAALKRALDNLFMTGGYDQLCSLFMDGLRVTCVAGDPGWEICRQGANVELWPAGAYYRAEYDPDCGLGHPVTYCDRTTFDACVAAFVEAQARLQPDRFVTELRLLRQLAAGWRMWPASVVEEVFELSGRSSVVVAPGLPRPGTAGENEPRWSLAVGDPIVLEIPAGFLRISCIGGLEMLSPPDPRYVPVMLGRGVSKEAVPVGSKLWVLYDPEA